nr:hypothetical protein CFP56_21549 [Quercus suber]
MTLIPCQALELIFNPSNAHHVPPRNSLLSSSFARSRDAISESWWPFPNADRPQITLFGLLAFGRRLRYALPSLGTSLRSSKGRRRLRIRGQSQIQPLGLDEMVQHRSIVLRECPREGGEAIETERAIAASQGKKDAQNAHARTRDARAIF